MASDLTRENKEAGYFGIVHCAAMGGGPRCFELLLQKHKGREGEIINQYNNLVDRALPLHYAVLGGNEQVVRRILRSTSKNPNKEEKKNKANAIKRMYYNSPTATKQGGVNAADSQGNTPLHFAVGSDNFKMTKLVSSFGGNALQPNASG